MLKVKRFILGFLSENSYLLWDSETLDATVIDPGAEGDIILDFISKKALNLRYILNTHGHADHIGANARLKKATGADLLISSQDSFMLRDPNSNLSSYIGQNILSPRQDGFLQEGDVIWIGKSSLNVIETPGHTMGSVSFIVDGKYIFVGDTIFKGKIGRTDYPNSSQTLMRKTLLRIINLDYNLVIYSGHGEKTTVGEEVRSNAFLLGLD